MKKWIFLLVILAIILLIYQPAQAGNVAISFDPPSSGPTPTGYKVYVGLTYWSVFYKQVTPFDIGNRHSYCQNIVDNIPGFFISVSSYNEIGESDVYQPIAYILYGNIKGDWDDGTSYSTARVDGQDQTVIGQYFGQMVSHQYIDCTTEFVLQIRTLKQKADLNKDGRIDGKDLSILGQKWGKTLPP